MLLDKNPTIRTVINKIDDVGSQNEYRTFQYELLAGSPSLEVEIKELDCTFRFDYSKVYWNSRLNTEHERLVNMFRPGDAVCDVMAGVGPFAVPAAKRNIFVWANDLNPESYLSLVDASSRNKVYTNQALFGHAQAADIGRLHNSSDLSTKMVGPSSASRLEIFLRRMFTSTLRQK